MSPNAAPVRLLLLKAAPQFAHTGKYALYGNPPRWHVLHHDKPLPKGAAVAAHPHAAGAPTPARSMLTNGEWEQLKLPAENSNASTFNKQIDQLKAAAAAGDVTGILGSGYGTNTYGKKLAVIANHVLELLGSDHKVSPGQKPGAHAAVQTAPQIEAGQPAPVEPVAVSTGADAKPDASPEKPASAGSEAVAVAAAGPKDGDTKEGADGQQLVFKQGRWHKVVAADEHGELPPALVPVDDNPEDAAPAADTSALSMPAFQEGKTVSGVVDYYEAVAQKVLNLAAAGDVAGLEKFKADGLLPNKKGKVSNTWAGKTPNSKLLLALHAQALEQVKGGAQAATKTDYLSKIENAASASSAQMYADLHMDQHGNSAEAQAQVQAALAKQAGGAKDEALQAAVDHLKEDAQQGDLPAAEKKEDAALVQKLEAAQGKPHELDLSEYKTAAWAPTLSSKAFKGDNPAWFTQSSGSAIQVGGTMKFEGQPPGEHAQKLLTEYKAAKDAGYEFQNFKTSGLQHAYVFVKDGKILTKEGMAALVAGNQNPIKNEDAGAATVSEQPAAAEPAPIKKEPRLVIPKKAAAPAPAAGNDKLAKIPWDAQLLPDSNANAKSHNKQVEKIKQMAYAGDIAGLEAFKAGKNTYGKKQNLLAQTALAALKEGAPAEPADAAASQAIDPMAKKGFDQLAEMAAAGDSGALHALKLTLNHNATGSPNHVYASQKIAELEAGQKESGSKPAPTDITPEQQTALIAWAALPAKDASRQTEMKALYESLSPAQKEFVNEKAASYVPPASAASEPQVSQPTKGSPPAKPDVSPSIMWQEVVDEIEQAIASGDTLKIEHAIANSDGLGATGAVKANQYAKAALAYLTGKQAEDGPKEGDTKQGADGMLVLKDGHWVKVDDGLKPEAKAAIDSLSLDELEALDGHQGLPQKSAAYIKEKIAEKRAAKPATAAAPAPATVKKLSASEVIAIGKGFKTAAGNKQKIKAFAVAGDMEGLKQFIDHLSGKMPTSKKLAEKVLEAMEAAPEVPVAAPKKASKPKAAPAPQPAAAAPAIEPMDSWTQTGPQGGSNPGGRFKDANGEEWYCKFPADEDTAKAEVLAAKLYAALGISGQDAKLVTKGGKVGIASRWTTVSKASSPAALAKTDGVASGFGADAWLGNWDVVGLGFDNLQIGADGKAHRVDAGGSLMYRAQGGKKAFGNIVTEIDSLRDKAINPQAAAVFGGMTDADITASVAKVLAVSDFTIATLVHKFGPGSAADKQQLIETLIARKSDLAAKFPAATKKKTPKFKPEEISAPPDFMNWGGSGKSGPSSKEFLNQANHKAGQNIFDAAKSGDIKAVQVLTAPIYNKDTGEIIGSAPVLEHPSQHIKGYAQQVINEINYQLNPPKKFRFDGGHPLHALNAAYPAYKGALQSQNVAKVAKFINLGEPGLITLESLGLEKKTFQSGMLSQQTYKKQAQAVIAKMPATQKEAVKAYTGGSYSSINGSLWAGNPSGQAQSAAQALHTLNHDIEPGTVLSRKINLSGADLQQLLNSKGKVLQEPAIMSTSIRPSCWSGNVHLKLHVGPGVKGLWAGVGSMPGGGALSNHPGEDEIILPPNTRLMIISTKPSGSGDADGFGIGPDHIVEAVILPSEGY